MTRCESCLTETSLFRLVVEIAFDGRHASLAERVRGCGARPDEAEAKASTQEEQSIARELHDRSR